MRWKNGGPKQRNVATEEVSFVEDDVWDPLIEDEDEDDSWGSASNEEEEW